MFLFSCNCIQSNKIERGQVVLHSQPGRKDENRPQGHHQRQEGNRTLSVAQRRAWLLSQLPKEAKILIREAEDYIWGVETLQVTL